MLYFISITTHCTETLSSASRDEGDVLGLVDSEEIIPSDQRVTYGFYDYTRNFDLGSHHPGIKSHV